MRKLAFRSFGSLLFLSLVTFGMLLWSALALPIYIFKFQQSVTLSKLLLKEGTIKSYKLVHRKAEGLDDRNGKYHYQVARPGKGFDPKSIFQPHEIIRHWRDEPIPSSSTSLKFYTHPKIKFPYRLIEVPKEKTMKTIFQSIAGKSYQHALIELIGLGVLLVMLIPICFYMYRFIKGGSSKYGRQHARY